jgi:hypothetical protein
VVGHELARSDDSVKSFYRSDKDLLSLFRQLRIKFL